MTLVFKSVIAIVIVIVIVIVVVVVIVLVGIIVVERRAFFSRTNIPFSHSALLFSQSICGPLAVQSIQDLIVTWYTFSSFGFAKRLLTWLNLKTRKVLRRLRAVHKLDRSITPFTVRNVDEAIRASKNSSAVGPDGLTAIHLKHLGHFALTYLTELFNLSIRHADIPAMWKAAIIVPILKPDKSADQNLSYRPILLLQRFWNACYVQRLEWRFQKQSLSMDMLPATQL
jgi:hypothetical protein